jgi:hypothetical protein
MPRCGGVDGTEMRQDLQGSLSKTAFYPYLDEIPPEL